MNDQLRHVLGLWLSVLHPCFEPGEVSVLCSQPSFRYEAAQALSPPVTCLPPSSSPTHYPLAPTLHQNAYGIEPLRFPLPQSEIPGIPDRQRQLRMVGEVEGGRHRDGGAVLRLLSNQSQYCSQRVNQHTRLAISKK